MDHDELRVVCDSYEGLWEFLRDDIDKNQPHTDGTPTLRKKNKND